MNKMQQRKRAEINELFYSTFVLGGEKKRKIFAENKIPRDIFAFIVL